MDYPAISSEKKDKGVSVETAVDAVAKLITSSKNVIIVVVAKDQYC
jgi:hypothetical protein